MVHIHRIKENGDSFPSFGKSKTSSVGDWKFQIEFFHFIAVKLCILNFPVQTGKGKSKSDASFEKRNLFIFLLVF